MKHAKKSTFGIKHALLIVSAVLILAVGVTATLAYLSDSEDVTNTFTPSRVTCYVNETVTDSTKSNVTIQNTGDIDAYIRVAVVANWVKGDSIVAPATVSITPANGWFKAGDYYYYPAKVAANGITSNLYSGDITAGTALIEGAELKVDILAEAIQAESDAINNWTAVSVSNGALVAKGGSN